MKPLNVPRAQDRIHPRTVLHTAFTRLLANPISPIRNLKVGGSTNNRKRSRILMQGVHSAGVTVTRCTVYTSLQGGTRLTHQSENMTCTSPQPMGGICIEHSRESSWTSETRAGTICAALALDVRCVKGHFTILLQ